jgi:UTP--glucose-1-phosphate uridylyltransferase
MITTVRKAVITAAGKGTRHYPATNAVQKELFPIVDRDGVTKPVIQFVVEEALAGGIEQICIITQPGGEKAFQEHFAGLPSDSSLRQKPWAQRECENLEHMQSIISYVFQETQEGFGHAVHCAAEWVGDEPFMLMLGDHIYMAEETGLCSRQMIQTYADHSRSVFGVQQTSVDRLHLFGTVKGETRLATSPPTYAVETVYEKPSADVARQQLQTPGLAEDQFLTFFGLYIFTPALFSILQEHIAENKRERGEIQLTTAQAELVRRQGAVAVEVEGTRLDMGTPFGYVETQLLLAMKGTLAAELERVFESSASTWLM